MMKLQLFSTLGCHLCEDAKAIIDPILLKYDLSYVEEEISEKDEWMEAYGVRIPVLSTGIEESELDWPFDTNTCELWLRSQLSGL